MLDRIRNAAEEIQFTALFLVVFGTAVTIVGCRYQWGEVKTLGASVAGAGLQAIVTQFRSVFGKDGGSSSSPSNANAV